MLATIPSPLQVIIDDVGWWSGYNDSSKKGPFRTGINRMHCLQDYEALISLARGLRTNIYAAFVACEWDRSSVLREVPTATWMGEKWSNPFACDYSFDEVRDLWHANKDCLFLALHGVGHEYWLGAKRSRSEFHDRHGHVRDLNTLKQHLDSFFTILDQNGISLKPELFVPPALNHNISKEFTQLLRNYNIRYVATCFRKMPDSTLLSNDYLHIDQGVMTFERGKNPVRWDVVAAAPAVNFAQPILPLHWANILHPESARNSEVVDQWIKYIRTGVKENKGVLTPNIRSCIAQYVFLRTAVLKVSSNNCLVIDFHRLRHDFPELIASEFVVLLDKAMPIAGTVGLARHSLAPYNEEQNIFSFVPESDSRSCIISFSPQI